MWRRGWAGGDTQPKVEFSQIEEGALGSSISVTVEVSLATKAKLEQLAIWTERSEASLLSFAVQDYVDYEFDVIEGIMEGIADAEAGRTISHEEAIAEMYAIIEEVKAKREQR